LPQACACATCSSSGCRRHRPFSTVFRPANVSRSSGFSAGCLDEDGPPEGGYRVDPYGTSPPFVLQPSAMRTLISVTFAALLVVRIVAQAPAPAPAQGGGRGGGQPVQAIAQVRPGLFIVPGAGANSI